MKTVTEDVKEVFMEVQSGGEPTMTRKRRGGGRRRTQKQEGGAAEKPATVTTDVVVDKELAPPTPAPAPVVQQLINAATQKGGAPAKLIFAPAKKKLAKLMLVPKNKVGGVKKKVFTAKRVRVTIDNTAKTVKRRRQLIQNIDAMTEEQLRNAVVEARLTHREKVAKVPIPLLRQMLKDYRTMKGMLL